MGNGGQEQAIQVDRSLRLRRQIMERESALADIRQMVDIIDDGQRARSKGAALLLKPQGLLAYFLQQSGQNAARFCPGVPQDIELRGHCLHFGQRPGRIAIPGSRLEVHLDHDQGRYDCENRQKERRRSADPALRLGFPLQIFLRLA